MLFRSRVGFIGRVRKLARRAAMAYVKQREELGFPMGGGPAPAETAEAR